MSLMRNSDGKSIILDDAPITSTRLTREGYLVADVRAARVGIYLYRGDEVGLPGRDVVRVYRPESTVFSKEALKSFTSLDVTDEHPPELINSVNWKRYAVGHTGEDVARDGEYVRLSLILRDQDTIDLVKAGKRGLSFGYTCDVDPTPGRTKDGEEFDATQTNLSGNHLAVVPVGRAGPECRIQDRRDSSHTGDRAMPGESTPTLRTVLVDGIPVQSTDAAAQVIETLQQRIRDANSKTLQEAEAHAKVTQARDSEISTLKADLSRKDGELGTRDAEISTLKAQVSDASKIDALVAERTDVLSKAKALGLTDDEVKAKTNQEIVRLSVTKRMGDKAIQGRSDDYVRCAFDFLSAKPGHGTQQGSLQQDRQHDPLAAAFQNTSIFQVDQGDPEVAHRKMVTDLESAWRNPPIHGQPGRTN